MAHAASPTVFVTGAAGFIGTELVKVLVGCGYQVFGLGRSAESAQRLRGVGAVAISGDLLVPGQWQDEAAAADWVFHIPPRARLRSPFHRRTDSDDAREAMDAQLFDAVGTGRAKRIVYVADSRDYGPTGSRPITEDDVSGAPAEGGCLTPVIERLDGYALAGLPIVTALPGCVYGNACWFRERLVDPILAGRRVLQVGAGDVWVSPIHLHDCARALVHLAERGGLRSRYFLADNEPVRIHDFARTVARLANRPLRVWRLPATAALAFAPWLVDSNSVNLALSNIRLRGTGFRFLYPTLERGIEQILGALHE